MMVKVETIQPLVDGTPQTQHASGLLSAANQGCHFVVCIINGLGDAFLALPVIRRIIECVGGTHTTVWAPLDVLSTVFASIPCHRLPIRVDRYSTRLFLNEAADCEMAFEKLCAYRNTAWVGLNAYYPLWPVEDQLRSALRPIQVWDFGVNPENYRTTTGGTHLSMREQYFRVLGEPFIDERRYRTPLITPSASAAADAYVRATSHSDEVIVIHTDTERSKQWTQDGWTGLVERIQAEWGCAVIALGIPSAELWQIPNILPPPSAWDVQVALIARARAFVGVDSCFAHIADALGTPGIVLFGPTSVQEWGPKGPHVRAYCAPNGNLCELTSRDVWAALRFAVGTVSSADPAQENSYANPAF